MNQVEQTENKKIKVIIAAEKFLYRLGIKSIINVIGVEPELFESNSFSFTKKCLVKNKSVDFLIMDEELVPPPKNEYINEIGSLCPQCKVLLIGNDPQENCLCSNYVSNNENQKEMVEKFQEFFFEPEPVDAGDTKVILSEREIEVLKAVANGYSNKEIADKLFISANTVITHRKNITDKLNIKTIAGLTVYAIMNGIIKPDEVKTS